MSMLRRVNNMGLQIQIIVDASYFQTHGSIRLPGGQSV